MHNLNSFKLHFPVLVVGLFGKSIIKMRLDSVVVNGLRMQAFVEEINPAAGTFSLPGRQRHYRALICREWRQFQKSGKRYVEMGSEMKVAVSAPDEDQFFPGQEEQDKCRKAYVEYDAVPGMAPER